MIAIEVMHFYSHICKFAYLAKQTGIATRHDSLVFMPKVKYIAQQVYCFSLMLNAIKEVDESALLHTRMWNG